MFNAKRADQVKLVFWVGRGMRLFAERLEDNKCHWPKIEDGAIRLTGRLYVRRKHVLRHILKPPYLCPGWWRVQAPRL